MSYFNKVLLDAASYGEESTGNSTTATLAGGATFTGTAEQSFFPDVGVSCYTDVAGTLFFDFSIDGTNWRTFPTGGFDVAAGVHEFHTAVKLGRSFRLRYINGSAAQSTLQIKTYYGVFRSPNAPLNQPLGLDADSILVRPTYPWLDIARGLTSGMSVVKKFGAYDAVGTTYTPLTTTGTYLCPTSAVSLELVSSSANDALNSTGAHEVTVVGIDANWNVQTVSATAHATDGTTAVAISGTWLRVYRAYVSKSGTYGNLGASSHVGTLTIRVSGGGAAYAQIGVASSFSKGQTQIAAISVPIGYQAYVFITDMAVDSGKTAEVALVVREHADDVTGPTYDGAWQVKSEIEGIAGGSAFNRSGALTPIGSITGPADIGFLGKVGTGTGTISVEFEVFMVNE